MAMIMLVAERHVGEPVVGPDVAERLSNLGISRFTLVRDQFSTAVILEGWAFDPASTHQATGAVFPVGGGSVRTFHEVQYVGVASAHREGNAQWPTPSGDSGSSS